MSESNNNIPMRITQLEEATAYEDGMYYAVAKAGSGTKKIPCNLLNAEETALKNSVDNLNSLMTEVASGGANLFDTSSATNGYLKSDGTVTPAGNWKTSDFIEVEENHCYYIFTSSDRTSFWYRGFYNENKELVSYFSNSVIFFKIPEGIKYIRFSTEVSPAYVTEDWYNINNTSLKTKTSVLSEEANDKLKAIKTKIGKNLLNPSTLVMGGYLEGSSNNGAVRYSANWGTSDFIPVEVGEKYSLAKFDISTEVTSNSALYFCNGYDENLDFVTQITNGGTTITIPEGVEYIRFSFQLSLEDYKLQLTKTPTIVSFEDYKKEYYFEGDNNNLQWENLKWTCVGDSLTEVNIRTSKHYFDYVSDSTGISVVNMGVSGTGYARGESSNFYSRIENVPTDSNVVTIFGSGNDLSSGLPLGEPSDSGENPTTLCGYINGTIDKLFAFFPLANLGIVTPTPWQGSTPENPNNGMQKYSDALVEICRRRSIPCLNLYNCSGLHPDSAEFRALAYSKDDGGGVHPDETGHKIIAPRFKAFLEELLI